MPVTNNTLLKPNAKPFRRDKTAHLRVPGGMEKGSRQGGSKIRRILKKCGADELSLKSYAAIVLGLVDLGAETIDVLECDFFKCTGNSDIYSLPRRLGSRRFVLVSLGELSLPKDCRKKIISAQDYEYLSRRLKWRNHHATLCGWISDGCERYFYANNPLPITPEVEYLLKDEWIMTRSAAALSGDFAGLG